MALVDQVWYCNAGDQSTTGYYAVTKWATGATIAAGALRRQLAAPAVGSERVFVCIIAGTTHATTEPTWVLTRGAKTTDNTVTWMEVTGQAALNGDLTNTSTWVQVKAATPAVLGQIIKRSSNASYQICTTAGAMSGSEPSFSDTAGVTTADTTAVWTSLGAVSNFTGGQAPHARLANASAANWFAAGNTVYVGDNHAESQSTAISISPAGSSSPAAKILCHNHSGSYPPASSDLTTGAVISTTAAVNITLTPTGTTYFYGLTVKAGVGASTGTASIVLQGGQDSLSTFDNCSFWLADSAASNTSGIQFGGSNNMSNALNNCTVKFAVTANRIISSTGPVVWQNTGPVLVSGSSVPTTFLILPAGNVYTQFTFEALDLSQLTGAFFSNPGAASFGSILIKDCALNASMTTPQPNANLIVQYVRCDSSAISYKSSRYAYEGTETTETSITRVGGAVDPTGQAQSRKIVTTANSSWLLPFKAEPYAIWNPTTGANVTVTVCGTVNAGALPINDDIWLEIEYLGSSSTPLGKIVTTTKASVLASNAVVASDGSSWGGGGSGAGWSPFKLTATLSAPQPQLPGYLHARVRAAKASTTFYIDPQVTLT